MTRICRCGLPMGMDSRAVIDHVLSKAHAERMERLITGGTGGAMGESPAPLPILDEREEYPDPRESYGTGD